VLKLCLAVLLLCVASVASAQTGIPILSAVQEAGGATEYSVTLQLLALMTVLTLLPSLLLMMTSFTRIIIVLSLLRQALGTAQTPPNQVLLGIALFLTIFVMTPVFSEVYEDALKPYAEEQIQFEEAITVGQLPVKRFMLRQTRQEDLQTFVALADSADINTPIDTPLSILVPAFITSELKSAFIIGFMLYIPFVIIDMVVASILMSMGMMMLSPMIISLPFKLLLFVMVDGWTLLMTSLSKSFI
jgi:flagellar biosynthetic protein FliP